MNEVWLLDKTTGKEFTKRFTDLKAQRNFIIKCKYSKVLMVLGYTWQSESQYEYLRYGR